MTSPDIATASHPVRLFAWVLERPRSIVIIGVIAIILGARLVPGLIQETSSSAFLAETNPALVYAKKIKQQFGLSDPIIVAVVTDQEGGIYNPDSMSLLARLTTEVSGLENIDDRHVFSLATAKNIEASDDGMEISQFLETLPETLEEASRLKTAVNEFPLYVGSLVAEDGSAAMIVAELVEEREAGRTYQKIMSLVEDLTLPAGIEVHVAGEGALSGFLGKYIEADASKLNPLAWLIISLIILFAFGRLNPTLVANAVIVASLLITLGVMAFSGVPFYVITSALPVILIGISVADCIHIYALYYEKQLQQPELSAHDLVLATMVEEWRPITLTTLTTVAGFLGLYYAAYMPPFRYFGLFATLGVITAWLYSMAFLPAVLLLTKPRVSARFSHRWEHHGTDIFGRTMLLFGGPVIRWPLLVLMFFGVVTLYGAYSATQLVVDEDPIEIMHSSEPLYKADKAVNRHLNGTNPLDIVIETTESGGLLEPANMRKIEDLQAFAATLPHVRGTASYVDYLKQMNRSLNGGEADYYRLPESKEMAAQYFLVYSATSDPTDFEEEIDYDYRLANLRLTMNATSYRDIRAVVEPLQAYVAEQFNDDGIQATLSGRVTLNYHWIKDLARSHFAGLIVALILVWSIATVLLVSASAGIYTLIPVAGSVLFIYAAMSLLGINLGVGTSMFAAVSIGLGVDFAIHTLDRLKVLLQLYSDDIDQAYNEFYRTTGRALLVNFLAISCGFGVLIVSKISSLNNFGAILVVSVTASFISSITVLPAMIKVFKPGFVFDSAAYGSRGKSGVLFSYALVALVLILGYFFVPRVAAAESPSDLSASDLVNRINSVEDGEFVTRRLLMTLTDRHGKERTRETINYRRYFDDSKRTVMFYLGPANIKDTAFLIWDYTDSSKDDDQWLYLPALRKVRRVSAADRGDYFLGTDFTYEDMKLDGKLSSEDYKFSIVGTELSGETELYKLESIPSSTDIAKELGYSKVLSWVDPSTSMIVKADFWDLKGRLLKTLTVDNIAEIDGILSRGDLLMVNHQSGHKTHFQFVDVDYQTAVDERLFTKEALERGR